MQDIATNFISDINTLAPQAVQAAQADPLAVLSKADR